MKLLVDVEMRMFKGLNVRAIFLQNIVTDLLLGTGAKQIFVEFADHVRKTYGVDAGFNSMNMPRLVEFLLECGIENPIVCSSINKAGYLMCPNRQAYEKVLAEKSFRPMAMSIMASGAVAPEEAVDYVLGFENVQSIVFGASSRAHIEQTKEIIEKTWGRRERNRSLQPIAFDALMQSYIKQTRRRIEKARVRPEESRR